MQVLLDNTKNGELKLLIDCLDDLWIIYNILHPGDQIKGRTIRRVVKREGDPGIRKPMTLMTNVEKIEFHEFTNRLRVLGTIMEGPEDYVSTGQHHTFNLEPTSRITIFKEKWFRNDIQRIRRNLDKKDNSMMLCVAIETGLANLALLSNYSLTPITELKENIPGKRYKKQAHKEAVTHFYKNVKQIINENLERHPIGMIIVCGPGFVKEHFVEKFGNQLMAGSQKIQARALNASSGEISAIYEVLRNGSIANHKTDFKIAQDEMIMTEFIDHLGRDVGTAAYGIDQSQLCAQMGAIDHLLICDILLRTADLTLRTKIEEALNDTEKNRGVVHILSTANPAGEQLEAYGKIAAILRYRVDL